MSDSALPEAEAARFYRGGIVVAIARLHDMVRSALAPEVEQILSGWERNVVLWAHGHDAGGAWTPPAEFHLPRGIGDAGIPAPEPRYAPPPHPPVDSFGASLAERAGPPPPPPWPGQDAKPMGGKIYEEIVRERFRPHAEDSEKP